MAKQKPTTYGQLVRAIRELKYVRDPKQSTDKYTVFQRRGRPLPIILPVLNEDAELREMYLLMVRRIVEENDSGDAEKFEALTSSSAKRKAKKVPTA